jgi:hypothetical protein
MGQRSQGVDRVRRPGILLFYIIVHTYCTKLVSQDLGELEKWLLLIYSGRNIPPCMTIDAYNKNCLALTMA